MHTPPLAGARPHRALATLAVFAALLLARPAAAISISWKSTYKSYSGLVVRKGRTPKTDIYVAQVSLCTSYVHVAATAKPSTRRTAGAWAWSIGAQLATNGDFFQYVSPPAVYGDAVGSGVRWPPSQTGVDDSTGWYYQKYGWIAFGKDWVDFSHTKAVKQKAASLGLKDGWQPTQVTTTIPSGTQSLVSGFPELVIEGQQVTCSSPTATSCFPDRSDMRRREPRTAMGLTQDRKTLLLVVVDGRTSSSAGMYGTELADLMHTLGAYVAFNLDGGGSSQMYLRGIGTIADADHSSSSPRAVANHWGVFAGSASGKSATPGSCHNWPPRGYLDEASCDVIRGWAQDPDQPAAAVKVELYFDSKPGQAGAKPHSVTADQYRKDLCTALGSCDHAFSLALPAAYADGKPHTVAAYAIDASGGARAELSKSPRTVQCSAIQDGGPGDQGEPGSDGPRPADRGAPTETGVLGEPAPDSAPAGDESLPPVGGPGDGCSCALAAGTEPLAGPACCASWAQAALLALLALGLGLLRRTRRRGERHTMGGGPAGDPGGADHAGSALDETIVERSSSRSSRI